MQLLPGLTNNTYSVMAHSSFVFAIFRCCSYAMERCRSKSGASSDRFSSFILFRYNFYLPYYFFGPVMTFDCFTEKVSVSGLRMFDSVKLTFSFQF